MQTGHPQLFLPFSQINIESFQFFFYIIGTISCYHFHEHNTSLTPQQPPTLPDSLHSPLQSKITLPYIQLFNEYLLNTIFKWPFQVLGIKHWTKLILLHAFSFYYYGVTLILISQRKQIKIVNISTSSHLCPHTLTSLSSLMKAMPLPAHQDTTPRHHFSKTPFLLLSPFPPPTKIYPFLTGYSCQHTNTL